MERASRINSLIELLKTEPEDVFLNYVLGIEYAADGKITEALAQFHKVLHLDINYIPAYYQQGKLLSEQGEKDKALRALKLGAEKAKDKGDKKSLAEFEEAIFMLED